MTTTTPATGTKPPGGSPSPGHTYTVPVQRRRRPKQMAAGIAIVAVAGLGGATLFTSLGDADSVITVAQPVPRGQVITEGDLAVTQLAEGSGLDTVSADQLDSILGQRAAADLSPGTVLVPDAVTSATVPVGDASLVPIAVPRTKLPLEPLQPGDTLQVVLTPAEGAKVPDEPATLAVTVSSVGEPDANDVVVLDVLIDSAKAALLAARVATGNVGLVLDPRGESGEQ